MESERLIKRRPHPDDRRAWSIQIARRGVAMLEAVEATYLEIEAEWAAIIGRRSLERIRADLLRVVADLGDGELPALRPTW